MTQSKAPLIGVNPKEKKQYKDFVEYKIKLDILTMVFSRYYILEPNQNDKNLIKIEEHKRLVKELEERYNIKENIFYIKTKLNNVKPKQSKKRTKKRKLKK